MLREAIIPRRAARDQISCETVREFHMHIQTVERWMFDVPCYLDEDR